MPLADLAVIVVAHPQVTYTQAVLSGLAAAGGVFVACDGRHLPVGMMLPLEPTPPRPSVSPPRRGPLCPCESASGGRSSKRR